MAYETSLNVQTGKITQTEITEKEIKDKENIEKQRIDSLSYAEKRRMEYPNIKDQLDYIFHNGVAKWKTDIVQPVKDKHPKP